MKRAWRGWILLSVALVLGPVAAWLGAGAAAQGIGRIYGQVLDREGKPFPDVTVVIQSEMGQTWEVKTDKNGKYSQSGLKGANTIYTIKFKVKDQVIWEEKRRLESAGEEKVDLNIKEKIAKQGAVNVEEEKKREEESKKFEGMKAHFEAGRAALDQAKLIRNEMMRLPADQRSSMQQKLTEVSATAISEFQAAEQAAGPADPNHHIVLAKLGEAYETAGRYEEASAAYQKAIDLKPDEAGYHNNLGNSLAKLGKVPEAMASYEKSAALDPANAANAWRNAGIVLYNANKLKEAIVPLEKAVALDPKNADSWYLLGASRLAAMETKQVGDRLTFVVQPGTVEAYQKYLELAPTGRFAADAKAALASLEQLGFGVQTKVKPRTKK